MLRARRRPERCDGAGADAAGEETVSVYGLHPGCVRAAYGQEVLRNCGGGGVSRCVEGQ
jgi:hypothetical protein